ncbi:serine hydrolase domain-containing protein [Lysobacter yangpyeongensis]|uniref:Serine hydrolase domain-containing protein n=1 Tax=Lysobacter yangpyeongensis TaxID=346182 RepID=A0ABW0SPX5_9GAMM
MRLRVRVACAGLLLATFATTSAVAGELDAVLARAMDGSRTPAVGVAVIRDGKVADVAVRGVRRNDAAEAVTPGDVWLIGSTSKPMTTALIAKLVERGTLSWDAPLSSMLPELAASMREDYRAVTLVQLLSHGAGLPENLRDLSHVDRYFTDTRPLPEQRLAYITEALQDAPVAREDAAFSYSNTGFLIAAVIAERATGKPFETLMREEVFVPLGMDSAGFGPTSDGQIRGHRDGKPVTVLARSDDGVPMLFTAAGNMHMSLRDWARFCIDQLAGGRGNGTLLKPESYRLMQTARPGRPAGLDWGVQPTIAGRRGPVLAHGGSDGNWLAWVALFPRENSGVLVVANAADDMDGDKVTHAALAELLPTLSPADKKPD